MIEPTDIEQAAVRIAPYIRSTPCIQLERGAMGLDASITLKLELMQHTGSFKPRGAFNRLLSNEVPAAGVVAASGGNHGIAVAYAAMTLGHRAEVFVPSIASKIKIQRLREYRAEVTVTGAAYADALAASQQRAAQTGALVIHAYDQTEVLAGQGTTARELEQQISELDTLLVAVGGGGFIGGIAAWYRKRVRIIAVEPQNAPTLARALAAGSPVDVEVSGIAADSLGARRVGTLMFPLAQQFVHEVITVRDDDIKTAQQQLWRQLRIAAEPGGATALAAIVTGAYRPAADEKLAVIVCGGNTDAASLSGL